MNQHATHPAVPSLPLAFGKGKGKVSDADLKRFRNGVNQQAQQVCQGIVTALKKYKKTASVKQSEGAWLITVGPDDIAATAATAATPAADPPITANITVTANTADLPAVINALGTFFGNWRVVAGLLVTGAAVVGGVLLLSVSQTQPQQD